MPPCVHEDTCSKLNCQSRQQLLFSRSVTFQHVCAIVGRCSVDVRQALIHATDRPSTPLSPAQMREVDEVYALFDYDRTGTLDLHEIKVTARVPQKNTSA